MKNLLLILALVLVAFGLYVQFGAPVFAADWPAWYGWVALGVGVVLGLYAFMNKKA